MRARAIPGVEEVEGETYRRGLALPHGDGVAELTARTDHVECRLWLADLSDLAAAVGRCRALYDLDADPEAVDAVLGADPVLGPRVGTAPGRRVPGAVDGAELAVRTVVGQQVSVAGARAVLGRMAAALGRPLGAPRGALLVAFPTAGALAGADPALLPMTTARRRTVLTLAQAIAERRIEVSAAAERDELRARLRLLTGVGDWTVECIMMRLGDTDAFPASDLGVRRGLRLLGLPDDRASAGRLAEPWRPWRAYAVQHLWSMGTAPARAERPVAQRTTAPAPARRL